MARAQGIVWLFGRPVCVIGLADRTSRVIPTTAATHMVCYMVRSHHAIELYSLCGNVIVVAVVVVVDSVVGELWRPEAGVVCNGRSAPCPRWHGRRSNGRRPVIPGSSDFFAGHGVVADG